MRWENLTDSDHARTADIALFGADAVTTRTFDMPEFRGITFHEVRARSVLNRVPGASRMPFEWTVNPYRGCTHACVYCFARKTHSYLDLDTGLGFDSQIVVKVNAPELLRRQLASRRWQGEHVAMGTNVDCYQRAEGRYRLMPGIIEALTERANPFSILTKGTLILRDLDLLTRAARLTDVGISVSVGFTDAELWRTVEPGTPAPERRLEVVRALGERGIGCGVLMAPVIPFLGDEPAQLRATVRAIAAAGATSVTRPGAAPAPGRARVVHGLARAAPPAPGPPLRTALRRRRLRPEVVPAPDHPPGARPGPRVRHRTRARGDAPADRGAPARAAGRTRGHRAGAAVAPLRALGHEPRIEGARVVEEAREPKKSE
ncbi:DNA repair photolyase [Streptomyces sp. SAI-129]